MNRYYVFLLYRFVPIQEYNIIVKCILFSYIEMVHYSIQWVKKLVKFEQSEDLMIILENISFIISKNLQILNWNRSYEKSWKVVEHKPP